MKIEKILLLTICFVEANNTKASSPLIERNKLNKQYLKLVVSLSSMIPG